jgi:predicted DNA-binding transcriptional regulator YafY
MRRADRLFQIVQYLRGGRLVTARRLSEWLEVSERTIYRDVLHLQTSGVPIEGAAGVGYVLKKGFDLPPLMFSRDEIVALVAGARLIRAWGGASMARAAEEALVKIESVLPSDQKGRMAATEIHAIDGRLDDATRDRLDRVERAIDDRVRITFDYSDVNGCASSRTVRPLGLWFWGRVWTLAAWCELRDDHRLFRIDRIQTIHVHADRFNHEPGKTLRDLLAKLENECDGAADRGTWGSGR